MLSAFFGISYQSNIDVLRSYGFSKFYLNNRLKFKLGVMNINYD